MNALWRNSGPVHTKKQWTLKATKVIMKIQYEEECEKDLDLLNIHSLPSSKLLILEESYIQGLFQ